MIHRLPTINSSELGFNGLAALAAATRGLWEDQLEVDFSCCGFFDANMAAALASILVRITDRLNYVQIVNVPAAIERILRKNEFLTTYGFSPLEDTNRTTLPFRRIQLADQGRFADYLDRYLRGKGIPRMTAGLGKAFRQSIFEVFQNAVTHSQSRLGIFVCGQFYPQNQRVDLTIADAGIGIRQNVRRFLKNERMSSIAAIRWALEAGHTTKVGSQPGGIGLKLLKDFITLNRGKIQITSRYGFYEFGINGESFKKLTADFPGTVVNFEINTSDTHIYGMGSGISPEQVF